MAPNNLTMSIFMPLVFMSKKNISEEELANVGQIIGDVKDTFKMGVNGYPIFHSCRFIHKEDWKLIREKVRRMEKAMARITGEKPSRKVQAYTI